MPSWKKVIISGSNAELASLYAPSITGSLQGTSSFAVTASYATTSSLSLASTANQILVLNQAGYTISKGIVVHITGSNTASDIPRIVSASYESDLFSANTLGIASETITNGSTGYVTTEGVLTGINTIEFQSGQLVYLGATGSITGSAPLAPLHSVRLGQIVREQSNNGSIYVRIDNGYELGELHDVTDTTTTTSYGDLLVKSGSVWTNSRQLTGSYGITGSLIITGSTSTDLVRITQTGTGNAFVVEDSTNPDVTPFIITNTGRVGIGISSPTVQLDVSGSVEITETAAYIQDGSNVIYIAKGTDSFYANIVAGAGAGTNTQHRQTVFGYAAGATASGSNQSAFGYNAGYLNTGSRQTAFGALAGGYNKADYQTAAGYQAGFQNSGSNQTAFGYATGQYNSGSNQTAVGAAAGQYNSAASQTAIGVNAGLYNSGSFQTAVGVNAGQYNPSEYQSVFGRDAGMNQSGSRQTAVGALAGGYNKADYQTAAGYQAGYLNVGLNQTAFGYVAGQTNSGSNQTAVGVHAGQSNSGSFQTAVGANAGRYNTASFQTAIGGMAGYQNAGSNQTAVGVNAGAYNSGSNNTNIGVNAGYYITGTLINSQSAESVFLGSSTFAGVANATNQIVIGYNATGIGSNSVVLGNSSIQTTALRGFVGIGITTPTASLHVNNTTTSASFLVEDSTSPDTTPFIIDTAGNVGIGTTTPTNKLEVNGSFRLTGTGSAIFQSWDYGTEMNISNISIGGWARAHKITTSDTTGTVFFGAVGGDTTLTRAYWTIGTPSPTEVGHNLTKGVHLLKNGFVGIGITTPTASLHINNTTTSASFLVEDSANPDTTPFIIDSAGNVGIGTTTPSHKLHLYNNAYTLLLLERSGSLNAPIQYTNSVGTFYAGISSNGKFTIGANPDLTVEASAYLNVLPAGNVGIGTTTPTARLDVSGSYRFGPTINGSVYFRNWDYGTDMDISSVSTGGWARAHRITTSNVSSSIFFGVFGNTTSVTRAYWTVGDPNNVSNLAGHAHNTGIHLSSSGDVGIGIQTPTARLHINHTGSGNSFLVEDSANPDTTPFIIDSAGLVGIGTTTPTTKLHVSGNAGAVNWVGADHIYQQFYPSGLSAGRFGYIGYPFSGSTQLNIINEAAGGNLALGTAGNANRLVISASGNVGIGTTTPTAKLDVNGNTIISGSLTTTSSVAFKAYTSATSFPGTVAGYLAFDALGNVLTTAGVAAGAAGSNTQIQYNNAGVLAGTSAITFDGTTLRATGSFTGSLVGIATSASYVATASYATIKTSGTTIYSADPATTNFNTTDGILIGGNAGLNTNSTDLICIGRSAGNATQNGNGSIFIGGQTSAITSGLKSIHLGYNISTYTSDYSNLIGFQVGLLQTTQYSTLIGYNVASTGPTTTIGNNNIIIGTNITLPASTANGINIGGVLFGSNTYQTVVGNPTDAPAPGGRIGIGVVSPSATLDVSGSFSVTGSYNSPSGNTIDSNALIQASLLYLSNNF